MKKALIIIPVLILIVCITYYYLVYNNVIIDWKYSKDFKLDTCISQKYTFEQLSYFSLVGFKSEYSTRWTDNITISLEKEFTQEDVYTVDSIINELAPLIKPLKIARVESDGNVRFHFTNDFKGKPAQPSISGLTFIWTKFLTREIRSATMYIGLFKKGFSRKSTMRHEMMHALGLSDITLKGRKFAVFKSRLDSYSIQIKDLDNTEGILKSDHGFTELDKAVIKMLYDSCLPIGLQKTDFDLQLDKIVQAEKRKEFNLIKE